MSGQAPSSGAGGGKGSGKGKRGGGKGMQDDLVRIVYGYGDEKQPTQESIELLESMVTDYVGEMCRQVSNFGGRHRSRSPYGHKSRYILCIQAYEVALLGKREVQTGDFIFLIRKDVRRYKRMKVRGADDHNEQLIII